MITKNQVKYNLWGLFFRLNFLFLTIERIRFNCQNATFLHKYLLGKRERTHTCMIQYVLEGFNSRQHLEVDLKRSPH